MDREKLLHELLHCSRPVPAVLAELAIFGWDSDLPLVTLEELHVREILRRYERTELSANQVEEWANAVEMRDDIDYDPDSSTGDAIHELANPALTMALNPSRARQLLQILAADSQ